MRSISRHSARLSSCPHLRASSRSRGPCIAQRRAFQSCSSRLADTRPPNGPSEEREQREREQRERENGVADEEVRSTITSPWDHGESRRPALRRTMRQRRNSEPEVPKPPPLPDWFLKGNVELVVEESGKVEVGKTRQMKCVDKESGHTLFHVPYYAGEIEEVSGKALEKENGKESKTEGTVGIPGLGMFDTNQNPLREGWSGDVKSSAPDADRGLGFQFGFEESYTGLEYDPLTWTLLETEAQARAAMSLSGESGVSNAYAASRADIHLHCPDDYAHKHLDEYVRNLANILQADLISLDANDIADLTSEYVGENKDSPGSFASFAYDAFDGQVAGGKRIRDGLSSNNGMDFGEKDDMEEDEEDAEESSGPKDLGHFGSLKELRDALSDRRSELGKMLGGMGGVSGISVIPMGMGMSGFPPGFPVSRSSSDSSKPRSAAGTYTSWDDTRLSAALDSILDAPSAKREVGSNSGLLRPFKKAVEAPKDSGNSSAWPAKAGGAVVDLLGRINRSGDTWSLNIKFEPEDTPSQKDIQDASGRRRTIVHVRDLKNILDAPSNLGAAIIKRLVELVQKRRQLGEEILVVGTTAGAVRGPLEGLLDHPDDPLFRLTILPPLFNMDKAEQLSFQDTAHDLPRAMFDHPSYHRVAEINLRHVRSMLRRLVQQSIDVDEYSEALKQLRVPGTHILSEKVLDQSQIQRMILTALGLARSYAQAEEVRPVHIALATAVLARADHATHSWMAWQDTPSMKPMGLGKGLPTGKSAGDAKIEALKKSGNPHEARLLNGVVDPQNIKTGFDDVHATPETIEALKSLTTLSLQRPDAFKYGVLANDRLTGLLLYGPPGTGKTLLAKAVAKESQATVLEVSGAQIYEKYVGEGEKMVRAVFSLAKKLSPCVVFIDEADAIFGSRGGGSGNRNTHREIINQFLREWDGMDNNSVFMMVASNRPFDLDDAVLRRLPRRLLVDLPVAKDRESILGIHLRHENLDSSVSLSKLAEQTPLYSGSDLKNLCVSAAIAAVREENEMAAAAKQNGDDDFKLPATRTLTAKHFEKAVQEISASISEDMSSLTAIRKFDEQYGDRKGRKKKSEYGFGLGDGKVDESSVRVRSGL